jgi:hypothetical protein
MKKKLNSVQGYSSFIILIAIILFLAYWHNQKTERITDQCSYIETHGEYTIGKVIDYQPSSNVIGEGPQLIKFNYNVNGKEFLTSYTNSEYPVPASNGPIEGNLYMVIYLPSNPKIAAMLYNYPVSSISDYNKYIEDFKSKRPKLETEIRVK